MTSTSRLDVVRWTRLSRPRARLVCFPCAGGTPLEYRSWAEELALHDVEVCALRLPGRESRIREEPFRSLPALIEALLPSFLDGAGCETFLFGHSMGALVAFELCHALAAADAALPTRLLIAARVAPHVQSNDSRLHLLPDDAFLERLRNYNGSPENALNNPALMQLLMPMMRADFELVEQYRYVPRPKLPIPIHAFGGQSDPFTPRPQLEAWSSLTNAGFDFSLLVGDHFFHRTSRAELTQRIAELTRSYSPKQLARFGT